jgi:hypothetical protein
MNPTKRVALLLWALGFAWLFIQFGRFLQEQLVLGGNLWFWVLWASLLLNAGLLAYLFDIRSNNGRSNPLPAPPQP